MGKVFDTFRVVRYPVQVRGDITFGTRLRLRVAAESNSGDKQFQIVISLPDSTRIPPPLDCRKIISGSIGAGKLIKTNNYLTIIFIWNNVEILRKSKR